MRGLQSIIVIAFLITIAHAGDISRKGTSGADQLLIPVGASSIATAGAFLSNVTGVEAMFVNPAGLSASGKAEALFSYSKYIADTKVSYFAGSYNVGDLGAFGLSFKSLNFGDIPVTTVLNPDGTGATFSPSYFVFGVTYSKRIADRVRAGVNVKYISETVMATGAEGVAIDFGVQYQFKGNLSLGVALKNVGGNMRYTGTDLQVRTQVPNATATYYGSGMYEPVTEPFPIPSMFEFSMAYEIPLMEGNSVTLGSMYRNNNSLEDQVNFGAEAKLMDVFRIRGGYEMLTQNRDDSEYGATFGFGVEYFLSGFGVNIDYAYRTFRSFSGSQVVDIKVSF
ncbi:MAG: PorV/PorQ family protein [Ignavibacteriales bacterium]|nr:PorV/PorQ family protein [Ignavibacteriales bacterium]